MHTITASNTAAEKRTTPKDSSRVAQQTQTKKDRWMDKQMDRWMNGWVDRHIDKQSDKLILTVRHRGRQKYHIAS